MASSKGLASETLANGNKAQHDHQGKMQIRRDEGLILSTRLRGERTHPCGADNAPLYLLQAALVRQFQIATISVRSSRFYCRREGVLQPDPWRIKGNGLDPEFGWSHHQCLILP